MIYIYLCVVEEISLAALDFLFWRWQFVQLTHAKCPLTAGLTSYDDSICILVMEYLCSNYYNRANKREGDKH